MQSVVPRRGLVPNTDRRGGNRIVMNPIEDRHGRSSLRPSRQNGKRPPGAGPALAVRSWAAAALLCLAACASPQPPAGQEPDPKPDPLPPESEPSGPIESVADQLRELGINLTGITGADRVFDATVTIDTEYSPLGRRMRIAPREIFAAGIDAACLSDDEHPKVVSLPLYDHIAETHSDSFLCHAIEEGFYTLTSSPAADNSFGSPGSQSNRTIVAGDFSGDGLEQGGVLVAHWDAGNSASTLRSYLTHQAQPSVVPNSGLLPFTNLGSGRAIDLEAAVGDFDGNGLDDIVVAIIQYEPGGVTQRALQLLVFLQTAPGVFAPTSPAEAAFSYAVPDDLENVSLRLASGNLDLDPSDELAVVLRSLKGTGTNRPEATVQYWVFDDLGEPAGQALPVLHQGDLVFPDPGSTPGPFLTADVAIGDFDGDGIGELAFTGILEFTSQSNLCAPYTFGYVVFDDLAHPTASGGLAQLAALAEEVTAGQCNPSLVALAYEVFAHALDYDGGYTRELLANDRVMRLHDGELHLVAEIPGMYTGLQLGAHFAESTTTITVGDFNNDGFDEVAKYDSVTRDLRLYGLLLNRVFRLGNGTDHSAYPLILAYDNDVDGFTVEYIPGSHRVVLTEPVIIAALAAPPYSVDYGQEPESATTSYGTSEGTSVSSETTVSFTVNATMGVSMGVGIGPLEVTGTYEATLSAAVDRTAGTSYATTYTNSFETAGQNAVVFTSFPYDAYDYEIVSSHDAGLMGEIMTVMLPREPVTRIVSTDYFNARVPEGGLRIDESVFVHTAGDVSSYLSRSQMVELQERVQFGRFGPDLFLFSPRRTVGQGSTSTSVEIELAESSYHTESVGYMVEHSVGLSVGGVMVGFSRGDGKSNSLTIEAGQSTIVGGTVPSITVDDTTNPGAVYDFGMFTYMYRYGDPGDPDGQLFQVVNYWAE